MRGRRTRGSKTAKEELLQRPKAQYDRQTLHPLVAQTAPGALQRLTAAARLVTAADVHTLQRAVGNRAVTDLIQSRSAVIPRQEKSRQEDLTQSARQSLAFPQLSRATGEQGLLIQRVIGYGTYKQLEGVTCHPGDQFKLTSYAMAGEDAGHTWIGIHHTSANGYTKFSKTAGYWPEGSITKIHHLLIKHKGDFQMDDGHKGHEEIFDHATITDPKTMKQIYKALLSWAQGTPKYHFLFHNCTHFVNKIRKIAGQSKFSHGLGRMVAYPRGAIKEHHKRRKEKKYKGKKQKPYKVMY